MSSAPCAAAAVGRGPVPRPRGNACRDARDPCLSRLRSDGRRASVRGSARPAGGLVVRVAVAADWREKARPITPGGVYPAKEHCSQCGLCDTHYVARKPATALRPYETSSPKPYASNLRP
jgi:hypothetical protein